MTHRLADSRTVAGRHQVTCSCGWVSNWHREATDLAQSVRHHSDSYALPRMSDQDIIRLRGLILSFVEKYHPEDALMATFLAYTKQAGDLGWSPEQTLYRFAGALRTSVDLAKELPDE